MKIGYACVSMNPHTPELGGVHQTHTLSDDQVEYQIRDRFSFIRFLGLGLEDKVPDAKTVWMYREHLAQAGVIEALFEDFDGYLEKQGRTGPKIRRETPKIELIHSDGVTVSLGVKAVSDINRIVVSYHPPF